MGRLRDALEAFEKAMRRLKSAVLKAKDERGSELYEFFRDSAIQRFEFTYELLWK
ncbi:MAG: nucleotidyltransferase substrate binding protein, partial [Aquificaceae bacterium]